MVAILLSQDGNQKGLILRDNPTKSDFLYLMASSSGMYSSKSSPELQIFAKLVVFLQVPSTTHASKFVPHTPWTPVSGQYEFKGGELYITEGKRTRLTAYRE